YGVPGISLILSCIASFYFLMIAGAPTSTLFPYTTLFRSQLSRAQESWRRSAHAYGALQTPNSWQKLALFWGGGCRATAAPARRRDRKSTRLNSSHVAISYAVFSLKKKQTSNLRVAPLADI